MADPAINLTMTQEELDLMLPFILEARPIPQVAEIDDEGVKTLHDEYDALIHLKVMAMDLYEALFYKGKQIKAKRDALVEVDKTIISSIKDRNIV